MQIDKEALGVIREAWEGLDKALGDLTNAPMAHVTTALAKVSEWRIVMNSTMRSLKHYD